MTATSPDASQLAFAATTPQRVQRALPWAKAMSIMLGSGVIGLAVVSAMTGQSLQRIVEWSDKIFGGLFLAMFAGLLYASVLALIKVHGRAANEPGLRAWFESGVQSANAIATLALTYTLLGISLGIGSLAGQELNPETIPHVIKGLTEHFSMAFMTTVIGLPVSAALRSALLVAQARAEDRIDNGAAPAPRFLSQGD